MKSVQLGQQVLPIGSPDPMAENEATREGHADAQRRVQRERERARVAAKALAAMRTADETAKTAREQSRWAKRDERLALYQQARIARQVTERAPDHEEQRSNTGQT
jgi:type IV secretory pathway TrbL component